MIDAPPGARQDGGDARPGVGDVAAVAGTNGAGSGTSGTRPDRSVLARGWALIAVVAAAVTTVNALSAQTDLPQVEAWKPWTWELTSGVMVLAMAWLPWLALAAAPAEPAWAGGWGARARFVRIHLAAALVFTLGHVAGMLALRMAVYRLAGEGAYDFGRVWPGFVYELRKDLLTYAAMAGCFWVTARLRRAAEDPVRPVSFDIRDGGRIIRTPLDEILAVTSAGNYVEFCLADGRRPLMRATLAAIEVQLERFGFVRAHRFWLVNSRRVTGLRPEGSGDWRVELGALEAPLSRRYPQALERLRASGNG